MTNSNRVLAAIGVVLLALVGLVVVLVNGSDPVDFEAGSTEAATKIYIEAILADDIDAAYSMLSPELQKRCTVDDFRDRLYGDDPAQIVIDDVSISGDTAVIDLEFTVSYADDAFDFSSYTFSERFRLVTINNEWRFTTPPWPMFGCSGS